MIERVIGFRLSIGWSNSVAWWGFWARYVRACPGVVLVLWARFLARAQDFLAACAAGCVFLVFIGFPLLGISE